MAGIFNQHGVPHLTTPNTGPPVSLYLAATHLGSVFYKNGIPKLGFPNACLPYPFGQANLLVLPAARDNEGHDPGEADHSRAASRPRALELLSNIEDRKENNENLRPSVQHLDFLEGPHGIATNASVVEIYDGLERTGRIANEAAEIALPSSSSSSSKSSLNENSFSLSALNVSNGSSDDEASAFPLSESSSPSLSIPSTVANAGGHTSHTYDELNVGHENKLDELVLRSPTACPITEDSCRKHDGETTLNPNTSLHVWSMPEEDGATYLDNFLKHHFFSQGTDSTTWALDQKKYTEPVVLHNVTKPGQVFSKSRKIPGLKACSAGMGDQSVVVLGWNNLAVWRRASEASVSSYPKSSCMYILETARKFELAMYSHLAGLRQKTPTEDLKHFHGTYLVHCTLAWKGSDNHSVKNWEICGDIRTVMTMTIGVGPVPGLLAGTVKFAGVEYTMLMARQAIMIRAYLEGTDWSTIPIIDYGPHYAKLAYHMADSAGNESEGFLLFSIGGYTSFSGTGSIPGNGGIGIALQGFEV